MVNVHQRVYWTAVIKITSNMMLYMTHNYGPLLLNLARSDKKYSTSVMTPIHQYNLLDGMKQNLTT